MTAKEVTPLDLPIAIREIEGLRVNPCLPAGRLSRPDLRTRGSKGLTLPSQFSKFQSD